MGESWDHRDNHLLDVVPLGVVELALEPRPPRPPARRVLAMGPTGTRGPEPVDLGFLWQRRGVVAEPVDVPLPSIGSDSTREEADASVGAATASSPVRRCTRYSHLQPCRFLPRHGGRQRVARAPFSHVAPTPSPPPRLRLLPYLKLVSLHPRRICSIHSADPRLDGRPIPLGVRPVRFHFLGASIFHVDSS
jgi:hypothetical protein